MIGGSPIPMYSSPPTYGMPYGAQPYGVPYMAAPQPRPSYLPTPPYAGQFAAPAPPASRPPQFAGNPAPAALAAPPVGNGWHSAPPATMPPVLAIQAAGAQQLKLRGSIPDAPTSAQPIRLPTPTELGLATPTAHAIALPSPTALGLVTPTHLAQR